VVEDNIDEIITSRSLFPWCTTLEHWALVQAYRTAQLHQDNRIGFDFASTDVCDDDTRGISGSTNRIEAVANILVQFENCNVSIDAHCGRAAPRRLAIPFSIERALSVRFAVQIEMPTNLDNQRLQINAWGRQVTDLGIWNSENNHRNSSMVHQGKGWVELYLQVAGHELPDRPSYYDGLTAAAHEDSSDESEDDDEDEDDYIIDDEDE